MSIILIGTMLIMLVWLFCLYCIFQISSECSKQEQQLENELYWRNTYDTTNDN